MKVHKRFSGIMLGSVVALCICLTPMLGSAVCLLDSSGAVYNFNPTLIEGDVPGLFNVVGSFDVPGVCPPQALSGSILQTSEITLELDLSVYLNTLATGCLPHATLAVTTDLAGNGTGVLLRFSTDGTFFSSDVAVAPCSSAPPVMRSEGSDGSQWRVAP